MGYTRIGWGLSLGLVLISRWGLAQLPMPNPDAQPLATPTAWIVKIAPFCLFDPENTLEFAVERRLTDRHALQVQAGYGWEAINLWRNSQTQSSYNNRRIWRERLEYRYYLGSRANENRRQYVAVEVFNKHVIARQQGTVGVGCAGGFCQYYQLVDGPVHKMEWGGHVKFGRQFRVGPPNYRVVIDFYVGLGVRQRRISQPAVWQTNAVWMNNDPYSLSSFTPIRYPRPSFALGLKIGYRL